MAGLERLILLVALAALIGAGVESEMRGHVPPSDAAKTSEYDQGMAKRTLRCGYISDPPVLVKDLNSGELSGFFVDLMAEIGQTLNLKIVWAKEVGWANKLEGLLMRKSRG